MKREHLKAARRLLGLTALELGDRAGVTEEKVFQVERGRYRPTREEAIRWADALSMPREVAFPEMFGAEQRAPWSRPPANADTTATR